jgi:hypothetical protein
VKVSVLPVKGSTMTNPMTPDQRRQELAEILAAAIVRLRLRAALPDPVPGAEKHPETVANCLEVPSERRLSVHTG